jgi:dTDP-glucose pyrophosphorylase
VGKWRHIIVRTSTPLSEAIGRIDASGLKIALVVDDDNRLKGVIGDGDVRRAMLRQVPLTSAASEIMNTHPLCLPVGTPMAEVIGFMRSKQVQQIPLVEPDGTLAGLEVLDRLVGRGQAMTNPVVLMAGGLGMRLRPYTEKVPKPMLEIGGKPLLERIINRFIDQGFSRFYLSVNYLAEMIEDHFQDGARWNIQIEYLREPSRLGTAGALSLIPQAPQEPIIVMNGDLLTEASYSSLLQFHESHNALATMAVREYDYQVPFGVVRLENGCIRAIDEKPVERHLVNAGIYVLSPQVLEMIPRDTNFDMTSLFEKVVAQGCVAAAYPLREYWLDIGRAEELKHAERIFANDSR